MEFSAKAGNETARVFSDDVGATLAVAREKAPKSTGHSEIFCHSEPRSGEESREKTLQRNHTGSFAYALPRLPFAGLFHDSPQSGAAAEIAVRLPLSPAAAARNSLRMTAFFGEAGNSE